MEGLKIKYTNDKYIKKYYATKALNQTALKLLEGGMQHFLLCKDMKSDSDSFHLGSAVDSLITRPKEAFLETFYVAQEENLPSDKIKGIVDSFVQQHGFEKTLEEAQEKLVTIIEESGWQANYKIETRLKKVLEEGKAYFELLQKSQNKTILSSDQNLKAWGIAESIQKLLDTQLQNITEYFTPTDVIMQLPVYFEYGGVKCKALLDMVLIEKVNGVPINVKGIDIKTTADLTSNFPLAYKKFGYDVQAAFYQQALEAAFPAASIESFVFVVESTNEVGTPRFFEINEDRITDTRTFKLNPLVEYYKQCVDNNWEIDPMYGVKNYL